MEWCVSAPQAAARGRVKASRCARLGRRTGPCEAPRGTAAVGRPGSRRASQPLIPEGRGAGGAVPFNHTKGQRAAAGGRACVCGWPFVLVALVDGLDLGGQRLAHVGGNSKLDASFVGPGQPLLIVQRRVCPQPPRGQAHGQRAEGGLKEVADGVRGRHVAVAELITTPLWSSRRLARPKAPSAAEPPGIPRRSATPRPCATR